MSIPTKPNPLAAILVYGRPTGSDVPQASWFRAADKAATKTAAASLKYSALELQTEAERELAIGVEEGVLKGSGRIVVGSVTSEVYRRIEEFARKAAGASPATTASGSMVVEQNANILPTAAEAEALTLANTTLTSATAAWDALRAGSVVLAADWDKNKEIDGWWPAVVTKVDRNDLGLKWRDAPDLPRFKAQPKYIAILHPDFLASGE